MPADSNKKKILVTGGCGYIGGHTVADLLDRGFEVVSVDNLSRGSLRMLEGVAQIAGTKVQNYEIDLCDAPAARRIFEEHPDIAGIIHFAAYKSVEESVFEPLKYYRNNLSSLVTVLALAQEFGVKHFIFSSSCTVYGSAETLPIGEDAPLGAASSPYGSTKQMGEAICADAANAAPGLHVTTLRYFNPAGAHPSGLIGEIQDVPQNLVPVITQAAAGKRGPLSVYGTDYPTRDGTCVRDYVHVMDIARAHALALVRSMESPDAAPYEIFNLGTGQGVTVLELVRAFENATGVQLPYVLAPRRPGDVPAIYADPSKARSLLGWEPVFSLEDMMRTAYAWETGKRE